MLIIGAKGLAKEVLEIFHQKNELDNLTLCPLQEALVERLGKNAVAFTMDVGAVTPPSVQLLPAKKYAGAPIGTSYDVRVYTGLLSHSI